MKAINLLLILLAIALFSCDDDPFFHQDDQYRTIDEEQEIVNLINGIYNRLAAVHDKNYLAALSRADDINLYWNARYSIKNDFGKVQMWSVGNDANFNFSEITGLMYQNLYKAIANTNLLIASLDKPGDEIYLGEVRFLRAYCYFKLARLFGTPPLITDIEVNYFVEKPTHRQVYEFIENDMLIAMNFLPLTPAVARIPGETPHQGMVKAVLAEIYLAMAGYPVKDESKYLAAANLARDVIDNADLYNYGLLDDMADLWKSSQSHNKENIFGLFFTSGGLNQLNNKGRKSQYNKYPYLDSYNTGFNFFKRFPNSYRKSISFIIGTYEDQSFNTLNDEQTVHLFRMFDPFSNPVEFINEALSAKWLQIDKSTYGKNTKSTGGSRCTIYLFRFAHTLLTYAEAKTRAGGFDESCIEAVNFIRRRANKADLYSPSEYDLPDNLTSDQFLDKLIWERAWEFCTEPEGRWFDIVRLEYWEKLLSYRSSYDQRITAFGCISDDIYFYELPREDRWLNPNLDNE